MKKKLSLGMVICLLLFCTACQSFTSPNEGVIPTTLPTTKPTIAVTTEPTPIKLPTKKEPSISHTMTIETYPKVDGSTATLPLSETLFMLATSRRFCSCGTNT